MLQNSNKKLEVFLLVLCLFVLFLIVVRCGKSIKTQVNTSLGDDTSCTKLTDSVLNLADSFKERYKVQQRSHQTSYNDLQRQLYNGRTIQEMTRQQLEDLVKQNEELAKVSAILKDSIVYNIIKKDSVIITYKTITVTDTIRKEVVIIVKKKKKKGKK